MTEMSLLARAQAGEQQAFAQIALRHERELGVFLYRRVHDVHVAQDLLQDTFLAAWKAIRQTPPDLLLRPWLYKIALNMARQWERRQRVIHYIPLLLHQGTVDTDDLTGRDEVQRALAKMKRKDAEVLLLRLTADLTYSEIGALLDLKPDAVRQRLHRARERFRSIYLSEKRAET
jgi:RNA polymerase sigma-70 factor (ECF subfamily)